MKRFEFSLERVRRWRAEQASLEELKLAQLRAECARLAQEQHNLELEAARAASAVLSQPEIEADQLTSLENYRRYVKRKISELRSREIQTEARIVEQRQRVLEARRRFELLDRLESDAWQEWVAAANKEQEQIAGELFLAQAARKVARGGRAKTGAR